MFDLIFNDIKIISPINEKLVDASRHSQTKHFLQILRLWILDKLPNIISHYIIILFKIFPGRLLKPQGFSCLFLHIFYKQLRIFVTSQVAYVLVNI